VFAAALWATLDGYDILHCYHRTSEAKPENTFAIYFVCGDIVNDVSMDLFYDFLATRKPRHFSRDGKRKALFGVIADSSANASYISKELHRKRWIPWNQVEDMGNQGKWPHVLICPHQFCAVMRTEDFDDAIEAILR
jgi:hypothetical protein